MNAALTEKQGTRLESEGCRQRQGGALPPRSAVCFRGRAVMHRFRKPKSSEMMRRFDSFRKRKHGGLAERLKAPVLKTGRPKGRAGSNPASVVKKRMSLNFQE